MSKDGKPKGKDKKQDFKKTKIKANKMTKLKLNEHRFFSNRKKSSQLINSLQRFINISAIG